MRTIALLLGAALAACSGGGPEALPEQARRLHDAAIVIDTHSDTTTRFEDPDWDFAERHDTGHMDLPRIREGGLDAQFWSIYLGRTEGDGKAVKTALRRIDAVYRMVERHADDVELAFDAADIKRIVASGRLASLMGLEGGHIIEDDLAMLRTFFRLGVRYMTLTHAFNTSWADSSGTREPVEPEHDGLTDFGRDVVREMNRLGMMIDVSHVSDGTFWDVLEVTRAPVIASHSSCRSVASHRRNMSDDMLRGLARNGGVIQINFASEYIDEGVERETRALRERLAPKLEEIRERYADDPPGLRRAYRELITDNPFPKAPLGSLLDHFDHAIRVAGPDHVGLGADWDGMPSMPDGLDDISHLPALTEGLLERGHSRETVLKVLGANLLRVMEQVERVARESRS